MSQPPPEPSAEALSILDSYFQALTARLAEEIVERQDDFDTPWLGNAERLLEKYGMLLQHLGIVYYALKDGSLGPNVAPTASAESQSVPPSGVPVTADTELAIGSKVLAPQQGSWRRAEIIALEGNERVRIHYTGWSGDCDETRLKSELQLDPSASEPRP